MERIPQGKYTPEFRAEAVKLAQTGIGITAAAKRLSVPKTSLHKWVSAQRAGKLADVGKGQRVPTDQEMELAGLRRELAETKQERDLLKKFAAYFAKESR